jgi:hypothetical protein
MDTHKNAPLTPKGREMIVRAVIGGLSKPAVARRIPNSPTERSGRSSRKSVPSSFPSRPLRRIPCLAGFGVEDLPGAIRQQQILG